MVKENAGICYVIYGKTSGFTNINLINFTNTDGFRILGADSGDFTGSTVASAGDVNGDGYGDIIIESVHGSTAYVMFGKHDSISDVYLANLSNTQGFKIVGSAANYQIANSVCTAGDFNGDGYDDVIIGASQADLYGRSNAGAAYIILNSVGTLAPTPAPTPVPTLPPRTIVDVDLSLLNNNQGLSLFGTSAEDQLGSSVAPAGDFNKDGFDDVIIAAPKASALSREENGISYIIFGSTTGFDNIDLDNLLSTQGFRVIGAKSFDNSGHSVALAGDVNKDGYSDVIIGAPFADINGKTDVGAAYVIFGKPSGFTDIDLANLHSSQGYKIQGAAIGDWTGFSVNRAGDVNGDGVDDVIIGSPYADPPNRNNDGGIAYVVYGKLNNNINIDLTTLSVSQGFKFWGDGNSGYSVSGAGDINRDGYSDIIIGCPASSPYGRSEAGRAYVVFGQNGYETVDIYYATSLDQGFTIDGMSAYDRTGSTVSRAGDINNDGYDDIIIGAPFMSVNSKTNRGMSFILYGRGSGFTNIDLSNLNTDTQGFRIYGANSYDYSGISVAGGGDINGDRIADIIIGAYASDQNGKTAAGASYIIYGRNGGFGSGDFVLDYLPPISQDFKLVGANSNDNSGYSVNWAGDFNGDGYSDIIIGARYASPDGKTRAGSAYVVVDTNAIASPTSVPTGMPSAPTYKPTMPKREYANVDLANLNPNQGIAIYGNPSIGGTVTNIGDFNGDGYDDVLIAAPASAAYGRLYAGICYVVFGNPNSFHNINVTNLSINEGFLIAGGTQEAQLTYSAGGAADVNGDGFDDIVISGHGSNYVAVVIFGKASNFSNIDLASLTIDQGFFIFHESTVFSDSKASSAGDVNGDGFDDIIIGVLRNHVSYLIFGNRTYSNNIYLASLSDNQGFKITGHNNFGSSVSSAGDFNGDGYGDIIVGAMWAPNPQDTLSGRAYVIFGKAGNFTNIDISTNFTSSVGFSFFGDGYNIQIGSSVGGAGDINGDGYDDIIIGTHTVSSATGKTYVIYGKSSDFNDINLDSLSAIQGYSITGAYTYSHSGWSVSDAGDVNGDGYSDLIIGAPGDVYHEGIARVGKSYVIFGKAINSNINLATFNITQGFIINGTAINDMFGGRVSSAGDFNGDGYSDIIAGFSGGAAYIIFNSAATATSTSVPTILPTISTLAEVVNLKQIYTDQGFALKDRGVFGANAGDVNGDGYDDTIIVDDWVRGKAYIIYGKLGNFADITLSSLTAAQGVTIFGAFQSVSGNVDINNDGYADVIIGRTLGVSEATTYVIFGNRTLSNIKLDSLSLPYGFNITGIVGSNGGISVSGVGDINKDGYDDILIGAPTVNSNSGISYIVFGKKYGFANIALASLTSAQGISIAGRSSQAAGYSVSGAGDINKDGYDDILIGAPNIMGYTGISYVLFGKVNMSNIDLASFTNVHGFSITGANIHSYTGYSINSAGDVNGDGYDDIIIGAYGANSNTGVCYIIFGKANFTDINLASLSLTQGISIIGKANDNIGWSVGGNFDINKDGYADVVIGTPNGATSSYVIYGKNTLGNINLANITEAQGFSLIAGASVTSSSGFFVNGLGDVNGDSYNDVLIGLVYSGYSYTSYVLYDALATRAPTLTPTIVPTRLPTFIPTAIPTSSPTLPKRFFADVDLTALNSNQSIIISGAAAEDLTGYSVSGIGDFNGDGFDDVIIGAYKSSPNLKAYAGTSYVIFGSSNGLANIGLLNLDSSQGFKITGENIEDNSGYSVAGAGDFNGDGKDDIIIGASSADPNERIDAGISYIIFGKNNEFTEIDLANLNIDQGFKILGANAGDRSGSSVAEAGDFNNDGFDDVIIGANNAHYSRGAAYVIFGKASNFVNIDLANMEINQGLKIYGANAEDLTGQSVASIGDANGDGYDDITIGAFHADPNGQSNAGISYIIFGRANNIVDIDLSSLSSERGFKFLGAANDDSSGFSVAGGGDINKDGYDDIIIGARYASPSGRAASGVSYIIFGNKTLTNIDLANFNPTQGIAIYGANAYDWSGYSVSNAGDVNGDGYSDIIIGAPQARSLGNNFYSAGKAYVIFGNKKLNNIDLASLDIEQGFSITGAASSNTNGYWTGISVSSAGDFNGDGYSDIMVGAYGADLLGRTNSGAAFIITDSSATPYPTSMPTNPSSLPTTQPSDQPTAQPTSPTAQPTSNPTIYPKYIGKSIDLSSLNDYQEISITGANINDQSGYSVASAGDFNGDGYEDIIIGAPGADSNSLNSVGKAYVIFGSNSLNGIDLLYLNTTQGIVITGESAGDYLGFAVASGDINKDGYSDVIIGAIGAEINSRWEEGKTYIIFGKKNPTNIDLLNLHITQGIIVVGENSYDNSGSSVASGDINKDGFSDIIIGAPKANGNTGKIYIIFGSSSPINIDLSNLNSIQGLVISGEEASDQCGYSVASGDVNNDGYDDIIIGAHYADSNSINSAGKTYVIFGNSSLNSINLSNLNSTQGIIISGSSNWHAVGRAVTSNDVNKDGYDDIIIGAYSAGKTYVIYGNQTLNNIDLINLNSKQGIEIETGGGIQSVGSGDVNKDGFPDIIIGALTSDKVYVVYGSKSLNNISPTSLTLTRGFIITGANIGDEVGRTVALSDINGDGAADIIIGAHYANPYSRTDAGISYVIYGGMNYPTSTPTSQPSSQPTTQPTSAPTTQPSVQPSAQPTDQPSSQPTCQPSSGPTTAPTEQPNGQPSAYPSGQPSAQPSVHPAAQPSSEPTSQPSSKPSGQPSGIPTVQPSGQPSDQPTTQPTSVPTAQPSTQPSAQPSEQPTNIPSSQPSSIPTVQPSGQPSGQPSAGPSAQPSNQPTTQPTSVPTVQPSTQPTAQPSSEPTTQPSSQPSGQPTSIPLSQPSAIPTAQPSAQPSGQPSAGPSAQPSDRPSTQPTSVPTAQPSSEPTTQPSAQPTAQPSAQPSVHPAAQPSPEPTGLPSAQPSGQPTSIPSNQPSSIPTAQPSGQPSGQPSDRPSTQPTSVPTAQPSDQPSGQPSSIPTAQPSAQPSNQPTAQPTAEPSAPTYAPTPVSLGTFPSNKAISVVGASDTRFKIILPVFGISWNLYDGFYDVILKQPTQNTHYIIFGQNKDFVSNINLASLGSTQVYAITNASSYDTSSRSVSILDDINNDGKDDLIIGVPAKSTCYVLLGTKLGFTNMNQGFTIFGANDHTGYAVSSAGDVNNDGFNDIMIGAVYGGAIGGGIAYVLYGKAHGFINIYLNKLTTEQGFSISAASSNDFLGMSLANLGDINGDGIDDIAVAALKRSSAFTGEIYVVYGASTLSNINLANFDSSQGFIIKGYAYSHSGASISGIGDINGDGLNDILIGSIPRRTAYTTQISYVIYGKQDTIDEIIKLDSLTLSQGFAIIGAGNAVTGIGDINNDGYPDILVSNGPGSNSYSYVLQTPVKFTPIPSAIPTESPSSIPSAVPIAMPSGIPTFLPSGYPSSLPSNMPLAFPSAIPSREPTSLPSLIPTVTPTEKPTAPTFAPTPAPTCPTSVPTSAPTNPTSLPTSIPTAPTLSPTFAPTLAPTAKPSFKPTAEPSFKPTSAPSLKPSFKPTASPTYKPTLEPSIHPSFVPTLEPTVKPTAVPTVKPSFKPTQLPSKMPTAVPTVKPSFSPTKDPTFAPTKKPTIAPSMIPAAPHTSSSPTEVIYQTIKIVNSTSYIGSIVKEQFIISTKNISITGNGGGDLYTIEPISNAIAIITDFNKEIDLIDLRNFKNIQAFENLNITLGSAIINLENNQMMRLLNLIPSDLTEDNFIFALITKDSHQENNILFNIIIGSVVAGGFMILLGAALYLSNFNLNDIFKFKPNKIMPERAGTETKEDIDIETNGNSEPTKEHQLERKFEPAEFLFSHKELNQAIKEHYQAKRSKQNDNDVWQFELREPSSIGSSEIGGYESHSDASSEIEANKIGLTSEIIMRDDL